MARIRSIKPEFWTDSKIVGLPIETRLLFIGIWNFADDHGCIDADPVQLRLRILPADPIDPQPLVEQLLERRLLREMVNDVTGETFFQVTNWGKHQRINRPSQPTFGDPDDWRETSDPRPPSPDDSPDPHATLSEPSVSPLAGKDRRGVEGRGVEGSKPFASSVEDAERVDDQFHTDFWPAYPPTNGRKPEKAKALQQWRKLTADQRQRAIAGAQHLAASDHIPKYAHRFLRRDTAGEFPFDDWQTPAAPTANNVPRHVREHDTYDRMLSDVQRQLEAHT